MFMQSLSEWDNSCYLRFSFLLLEKEEIESISTPSMVGDAAVEDRDQITCWPQWPFKVLIMCSCCRCNLFRLTLKIVWSSPPPGDGGGGGSQSTQSVSQALALTTDMTATLAVHISNCYPTSLLMMWIPGTETPVDARHWGFPNPRLSSWRP